MTVQTGQTRQTRSRTWTRVTGTAAVVAAALTATVTPSVAAPKKKYNKKPKIGRAHV